MNRIITLERTKHIFLTKVKGSILDTPELKENIIVTVNHEQLIDIVLSNILELLRLRLIDYKVLRLMFPRDLLTRKNIFFDEDVTVQTGVVVAFGSSIVKASGDAIVYLEGTRTKASATESCLVHGFSNSSIVINDDCIALGFHRSKILTVNSTYKSQVKLEDEARADIGGDVGVIRMKGNSSLSLYGNCLDVEVYDTSYLYTICNSPTSILSYGKSKVVMRDHVSITSLDQSHLVVLGKSKIISRGEPIIEYTGNISNILIESTGREVLIHNG